MTLTAAPMIVAPIAGLLASRTGVRVLPGTGLTLRALGLAWHATTVDSSTPNIDLVPGFILAGIGMGLAFASSATAVLADMAPADFVDRGVGRACATTPALCAAILTGAAVVALGALATIWLPRGAVPTRAPEVPSSVSLN